MALVHPIAVIVVPAGHRQSPIWHVVPPAQVLPQVPQLRASVCVLTHAPPHVASPAPVHAHAPDTHTWPPLHALPQRPQCDASDASDTHAPPHITMPDAQAHTPDAQV